MCSCIKSLVPIKEQITPKQRDLIIEAGRFAPSGGNNQTTHFLVIPKAHIGSCGEISPQNSAVVAHAFEVISQVTKDLGITDFRVVSNCGEQAGQSVHHLHFHVLAGRDMTWPPG